MSSPPGKATRPGWVVTTHDWARDFDHEHMALIRAAPTTYAPGGIWHLVLEALAYAADEAQARAGWGLAFVVFKADGSVTVADDGRGTDTRVTADGEIVRKPVVATKDIRFFDGPAVEQLPDGHPRRGLSVVAALSSWLEHTNRRTEGCWTQRYENGIPVADLASLDGDGTTGTTVAFQPINRIDHARPTHATMHAHASALSPQLTVALRYQHGSSPMIYLRDMTQDEFDAFWGRQEHEYIESLSSTLPADAARTKARQDRQRLLPEGLNTSGHRLISVEDQHGHVIGQVWLCLREPQTGTADVAWLYQIRIDETARRRGYARAVMGAVEATAREAGATQLGLNVFGQNTSAIALYESCGYAVTTQQMTKDLT